MANDILNQNLTPSVPAEAYQPGLAPGAAVDTPNDDTVWVQLSDSRIASLPTSSLNTLKQQDPGLKLLPTPQHGQALVQLSDKRAATVPLTSVDQLGKTDPNFRVVANGSGSPSVQAQRFSGLDTARLMTGAVVDPASLDIVTDAAKQGMEQERSDLQNQPDDSALTRLDKDTARTSLGFINGRVRTAIGVDNLAREGLNKLGANYQTTNIPDTLQPQGTPEKVGDIFGDVAEFVAGDAALKGVSWVERADKALKAAKAAKTAANESPMIYQALQIGMNALRTGAVGTGEALSHGNDLPTSLEEGALTGAGSAALDGAGAAYKALRGDGPGLLKQIFNGADVAQEPAQDAVRTAVGESAQSAKTATPQLLSDIDSEPLLKGNQTILDDHLKGLQDAEKSAYKQVDDTVGFDLKAERQQLSNDQYKLAQLGNTDADVTARGKLLDAINDSQDRINQAQKALTDAGIDPKAADALHTQRMAGVQFKQSLIKNMNQDGSVKIDGLLKDANNLRNYKMPRSTKFVDRLEQFFGSKQAADSYVEQLQKAQQLGVHAVKAQNVVSYAGKLVAKGVGLGAGIDIAKHFIE